MPSYRTDLAQNRRTETAILDEHHRQSSNIRVFHPDARRFLRFLAVRRSLHPATVARRQQQVREQV